MSRFDGLRLSLTTFTVLPIRAGKIDRRTGGSAMVWSPVVGAGLAVVVAAVMLGARFVFAPNGRHLRSSDPRFFATALLAAAIAIAVLALVTRGLHLDGLADTVDGLASHKPADQALAIMSSGPIGALGAAALIGVLALDVLALALGVFVHHGTQSLVVGVLCGRLAMVWSCTTGIPAARNSGMGALVAGTVSRRAAWAWTVVVCAGAAVYGRFDTEAGSVGGAIRAFAAVAISLIAAWLVRRHIVRRLGGITGDVLGALCEFATLVSLLVTAAH